LCGPVKLRYYLVGRHFTIETDHKGIAALRWILQHDKPGRLTRWALLLQEFNFTIHAKPGVNNANADALSRLEEQSESSDSRQAATPDGQNVSDMELFHSAL